MDGHRHVDPVTDASLDREIETMLAVEPSAEFLARVRARVVEEPAPGGWRVRWDLGLAAAAVVAVAAAVVLWRTDNGAGPEQARATHTPAVERSAPAAVASAEPPESRPTLVRTPPPRRAPPATADTTSDRLIPLVNEEDAKAFDALLATLRNRELVLTFSESPDSALAASTLAIAPIEINPLPDLLEGGFE
jgi:hypothetical protein